LDGDAFEGWDDVNREVGERIPHGMQIFDVEGGLRSGDGQEAFSGESCGEAFEVGRDSLVCESNGEERGDPGRDDENEECVQSDSVPPVTEAHSAQKIS
jgi:hypothetical protein